MFEAHLLSAATLKKVFNAVQDYHNEGIFECSTTGIQLQAMDNSRVSLVSITLRSDGFDKFTCDRNISMGMNLANVAKILKCADNDDKVTLKGQDIIDTVTFIFESQNQKKVSEFEMLSTKLKQENMGIPETEYSCVIRMPASLFAEIFVMLSKYCDMMVISCTEKGVKFSSIGDFGTLNGEFKKEFVTFEMTEPVRSTFDCRYLSAFTKATPLADQVQLSMSPDVPLVVEYRIPEFGHIRYYLAAKKDDDS